MRSSLAEAQACSSDQISDNAGHQHLVCRGLSHDASRCGRSVNAVYRVLRGATVGKSLKISGMDRIDIHAWHTAVKSLPTASES